MRVPQIIQVDHFSIKTHGNMGESMCIIKAGHFVTVI